MTGQWTIYEFRFDQENRLERVQLDASPENWSGPGMLWFKKNGARACVRTADLDKARYGVYYSESPDMSRAYAALLAKLERDLASTDAKADALRSRISAVKQANNMKND